MSDQPLREIRFRIWHTHLKEMYVTDDLYRFEEEMIHYNGDNDCIIDQFTGLKDNHGEDIYEGDLIQFDINGITHGPEREEGIIGRVWHCDEDACWAIGRWTAHHHDGKAYDWWYTFTDRIDRKTLVVLGNVHEHPEIKEKP